MRTSRDGPLQAMRSSAPYLMSVLVTYVITSLAYVAMSAVLGDSFPAHPWAMVAAAAVGGVAGGVGVGLAFPAANMACALAGPLAVWGWFFLLLLPWRGAGLSVVFWEEVSGSVAMALVAWSVSHRLRRPAGPRGPA